MSEYEPQLFIVDKDGFRWYETETLSSWEFHKGLAISCPILLVIIGHFTENDYVLGFGLLVFAYALFRLWIMWEAVIKLRSERAYRRWDMEEKTKLEATRVPIPRQEPHGRTPTDGII